MVKALVILAEGFEEIEAVTVIDLLRRAGIEVTTTSIDRQKVTGSHQISVIADSILSDVYYSSFDVIILPGGMPGSVNLRNSEQVRNFLTKQKNANKTIAAICSAPTVFEAAGLLKGKSVTSHPSDEQFFKDPLYKTDNVVIDDKIVTSRAVGTAIDFSLSLIEMFVGKKIADEIALKILYQRK